MSDGQSHALPSIKLAQDSAPDAVEQVEVQGIGTIPYQRLFEATSEPGESLDAFAARIAPRLRAFSDVTSFEACGALATDGTRFGVVIGSNRAHIACINFHTIVPEGMTWIGETIHSHGTDRHFRANRADKALSPEQMSGARGMMSGVGGQRLDAFSPMDYHGGPGYLAAPGQVLHQAGKKGTARVVNPPR